MSDTFTWNRDYGDHEQVRPYLAEYDRLRKAGLSYNDDFKGKIPGLAGSPDEDKAIYMLSCLWRIEGERAEIADALADGFAPVASEGKYADVLVYRPGRYVGGTGSIARYEQARVVFDGERASFILPKGARTRGHYVPGATVLVR